MRLSEYGLCLYVFSDSGWNTYLFSKTNYEKIINSDFKTLVIKVNNRARIENYVYYSSVDGEPRYQTVIYPYPTRHFAGESVLKSSKRPMSWEELSGHLPIVLDYNKY